MATLLLKQTWINLLSSGEGVGCWSARGRTSGSQAEGQVARFAGGRFRAITTQGTRRTVDFTLRDVSSANLAKLESWIGQTVVLRDTHGRRWFGVYFGLAVADRITPGLYEVGMQLTEVSFNEGA